MQRNKNQSKTKKKGICQHTFGAIANFVVNSRSRFARNIILVENNQFRSSQLTPSAGTLAIIVKKMTEIKFTDIDFFIPHQENNDQRDSVFRNIILEFAINQKIITKTDADNWEKSIGKIYTLTNFKEKEKRTFTVGQRNPLSSTTILSIIYTPNFYLVINFGIENEGSLSYSLVSLDNNTEIFYFK